MDIQAIRVEIQDLCRAGARFVLCDDGKAAKHSWNERMPDAESVIAHLYSGRHVGIVPGSLGMIAFDVDRGDIANVLPLFESVNHTFVRSGQEGRYHIWAFKPEGTVGNAQWAYGDAGGDVRSDSGYLILWNEAAFVELTTLVYEAPERRRAVSRSFIARLTKPPAKAKRTKPKVGERNTSLFKEALKAKRTLKGDALDKRLAELADGVRAPDFTQAEIDGVFASADKYVDKADGKPVLEALDMVGLEFVFADMSIEVRKNIRTGRDEFYHQGAWKGLDDYKAARLAFEIKARYMVKATKPEHPPRPALWSTLNFERCLKAIVAVKEVDPFIEWLEALPDWDGAERLSWLLQGMFDAEDNELTTWASKYCLTAAIQRAYEPGCSIDQLPVLIGDKGIGKSTFVQYLLPKYQWYGSKLDMGSYDTRRRVECLLGKVIVEWAELDGIRKAQWSSVKAFLTDRDDGQVRLAYAREPVDMPRRVIFIGTANDTDALPNDGNIRRLVPIKLNRAGRPWEYLPRIREQLWAEALQVYRNGYQARLPEELHEKAKDMANQYRYRDAIEEELEGIVDDCINKTTTEVAMLLGFEAPHPQSLQNRITKALGNLGLTKKRRKRGDKRPYLYVPKK